MGISESIMIEKYAALMSDEPFSTYIEKYVDATNFASLKESLCSAFLDKITPTEKLQHIMTIKQEPNEPIVKFFMRITGEFEGYASLVKQIAGTENLLLGIDILKQQAFEQGLHDGIRRFIRERGACENISESFKRAKLYEEINGITAGISSLSAATLSTIHDSRGPIFEPRGNNFRPRNFQSGYNPNQYRGRGNYYSNFNAGSYNGSSNRGNFRRGHPGRFPSPGQHYRGNRGYSYRGYPRQNFQKSMPLGSNNDSMQNNSGNFGVPNANASTSIDASNQQVSRKSVFCVLCKSDTHHTYSCEIVLKGRRAIEQENANQGN
ncbi:hypothetical protein QYM36_005280 [Artemia franciscana]|uniref:Uncharacterized protein n=1 Tax=Artemia franciscana TaxID=6661 RepID=A0AA88I176_ARTSF|nr:hypothetical protein QYM36_005280 [Artemia franciscana]